MCKIGFYQLHFFFENIAHTRFSVFFSDEYLACAGLAEEVTRVVLGIFAALAVSNIFIPFLPLQGKKIIDWTLSFVAGLLAVHLFLQKIQKKYSDLFDENMQNERGGDIFHPSKKNVSEAIVKRPVTILAEVFSAQKKVRRSLLSEFEKSSPY